MHAALAPAGIFGQRLLGARIRYRLISAEEPDVFICCHFFQDTMEHKAEKEYNEIMYLDECVNIEELTDSLLLRDLYYEMKICKQSGDFVFFSSKQDCFESEVKQLHMNGKIDRKTADKLLEVIGIC